MATLLVRYGTLRIQIMFIYKKEKKDKHIVQHYLVWVEEKYLLSDLTLNLLTRTGWRAWCMQHVQKERRCVFHTVHKRILFWWHDMQIWHLAVKRHRSLILLTRHAWPRSKTLRFTIKNKDGQNTRQGNSSRARTWRRDRRSLWSKRFTCGIFRCGDAAQERRNVIKKKILPGCYATA